MQRHGKGGPAKEDTVTIARFELNRKQFICNDSYGKHVWTLSPAISLYVECRTGDELEKLFHKLSENGKAYMSLDHYGFSRKFGWVEYRFRVSWQLDLQ